MAKNSPVSDLNLEKSTPWAFEKCSTCYPIIDEHWGCDLDILKAALRPFKKPTVVDMGCGPGWHIANLLFLYSGIRRIIGVDYSSRMIGLARRNIEINHLEGKVKLIKGDITKPLFPGKSVESIYCLNNTLGNIFKKSFGETKRLRLSTLENWRYCLKRKGRLVLSVYNAKKLDLKKDKYGKFFRINRQRSEIDNNDFVIKVYPPEAKNGIFFYSHWFTEEEITKDMRSCGFLIEGIEKRKERIVIIARA